MRHTDTFFRSLLCALLACGILFPAGAQETYRYASRDTCDLYLDLYRPAPGSETSFQGVRKPTVLFVFGGGFITGSRDSRTFTGWLRRLAESGYTAVSIDYRLGMKGFRVGKGLSGVLKASDRFFLSQQLGVEDVFSAVSFLAEHPELGVDPDNIVIAGSSAGAIISLASEYEIMCGRTEGLPAGFNFRGVMSFAGAVISTSGAPAFPAQPCPIVFFHGTADKAVAYGRLNIFRRGIWGSSWFAEQFAKKGYPYTIYRFKDRTHDVAAYMSVLWDEEMIFLQDDVMLGNRRTVDAMVDDESLPSWGNITVNNIYGAN